MQPFPTWQNIAQTQQQISPYPDRLAFLQQQQQQPTPYGQMQPTSFQPAFLNGQIVDSIDVVKAKDVDLSGAPVWYPKSDGTEIYRKQLQPDGRSQTLTYRLVLPDSNDKKDTNVFDAEAFGDVFDKFKQEVLSEISEIKSFISSVSFQNNETSKQTKAGSK